MECFASVNNDSARVVPQNRGEGGIMMFVLRVWLFAVLRLVVGVEETGFAVLCGHTWCCHAVIHACFVELAEHFACAFGSLFECHGVVNAYAFGSGFFVDIGSDEGESPSFLFEFVDE